MASTLVPTASPSSSLAPATAPSHTPTMVPTIGSILGQDLVADGTIFTIAMVIIFGGAMCCIAWSVKKEALKMFMDDDSDDESVTGRPPVINKVKKMEEMKKMPFYKKQKQPENPLKREARLEKARLAALKKKEAERLAEEKKNKKKKPVSNGSPLGSPMDGGIEAPHTPSAKDEEEGRGDPGPWSTYSYAYEKTVEAERKKKAAEHEAWKAEMMGELAAAEEAAQKDAAAEERAAMISRERQEAIARDRAASFSALPLQTSPGETPSRGARESKESMEDFKAMSAEKRASKKAAEAERRKAKRAAAEAEANAWQAQRMNTAPEQI